MSADNWAVCPRCLTEATNVHATEEARIAGLYGQVPVGEFDAERAALAEVDPEKFRTFREDYDFYGAEEGEVRAKYSGGCKTCGLSVSFEKTKRFWPGPRGEA